jgi:hypothetical protein
LRADAARNREKLLVAAKRLFGERGIDVPMEHIEKAAAEPDPWQAFVGYLEGLFALHAEDRGFNDVLAGAIPNATVGS